MLMWRCLALVPIGPIFWGAGGWFGSVHRGTLPAKMHLQLGPSLIKGEEV